MNEKQSNLILNTTITLFHQSTVLFLSTRVMTKMNTAKSSLMQMPFEIIADVSQYLDLCSTTCLMDTCRYLRYLFLSSKQLWRKIHIDLSVYDLGKIYSSLRKLDDDNKLRDFVTEVNMDNVDDPDLSPIIMIIKFPNIQVLSAKNRKENTNLEVDIKLLQEMLKHGGVKPKSLPIRSINVYHHYMDYEPYISTYQDTWNRLSIHSQVEMDIRQCGYSLTLMQLNNMSISSTDHNINHDDNSTDVTVDECHRIISTNAQCWCCGYHFDKCWKCESLCMGCNSKRLTPSANDIQIKIKSQRHKTHTHLIADEEDFSVFE